MDELLKRLDEIFSKTGPYTPEDAKQDVIRLFEAHGEELGMHYEGDEVECVMEGDTLHVSIPVVVMLPWEDGK
jgi:hypothetical protein